jgi:hypothetical protein
MNAKTQHTLAGGANLPLAQFNLLKSVNSLVKIQNDVCAIRDEQAVIGLDAVSLKLFQFLEEAWQVNNGSGTDQVHAGRVDEAETGWDHMVVKRLAVGDNGLYW